MKIDWSEPGVPVSIFAHAALFVASLVALSSTQPFADAQETVPVDVISAAEFNAITKGERTAKEVQPTPRVEKVAEAEELKPTQGADATDVPTPPSRAPDIAEPASAPPLPPVRPPEPVKPAPKAEEKPVAPQKPDPPKAEAEIPKPPEKPQPPKPPVKPPEPPKPVAEKPKPKDLDKEIAQILEDKKREEKPKPPARVKAPEPDYTKTQAEIAKMLISKDKPQNAASTGAQMQRIASLGAQAGSAPKLSPSMMSALVGLLREQFLQCFKAPPGLEQPAPGTKALVHIEFMGPSGSLAGRPSLRSSSSDPGTRALSEAALSAVAGCAPYRIPDEFAPYFDEWRDTVFQVDLSKLYGSM